MIDSVNETAIGCSAQTNDCTNNLQTVKYFDSGNDLQNFLRLKSP